MTSIPTPALVIDLAAVKRNIRSMADYARRHKLKLRPHAKTHKSLRVARMQLDAGAAGLAVAMAGEARLMAWVCDDLLVEYPALDEPRCRQIADLARAKRMAVAVDSELAADALVAAAMSAGSTIGILVDVDVGFGRTGVQSPEAALALAPHLDRATRVRLDGILCYPGHVSGPDDRRALAAVGERLDAAVELWRRHGLRAAIVSGGSTPTAPRSHLVSALTEIRPGTYVYNDMNTVRGGCCRLQDCAARVVCTVVSEAAPGKVVIDAGCKALSSERSPADPADGFGCVVEYPAARVTRLSEEHGEVNVSRCKRRPRLGERVCVIPNHICPCVNLYDAAWLRHKDGGLERMPIDARGLLS